MIWKRGRSAADRAGRDGGMRMPKQDPRRPRPSADLSCALWALGATLALAFPAVAGQGPIQGPFKTFPPMQDLSGGVRWVDTHAHLDGKLGESVDFEGAAETALAAMDRMGIKKTLVMPAPQPPAHRNLYECDLFLAALRRFSGRFAFLCGGGSLNPMIQEVGDLSDVSERARAKFAEKAEALLAQGAVGFGEMTAMHLSHFSGHPFEAAAPDHPLFLLLADIAARHEVVIDMHMDAVVSDIPLPARFSSPPNPPTLRANVGALERLLAQNRKAKIVWEHAGSDFAGQWTVALSRALLAKHPNLYMSIRINPPGVPENSPFTEGREIKPEWLELLRAFPDRFVLGSDTFYGSPRITLPVRRPPPAMMLMPLRMLLARMPPDIARSVGSENAARIYRLKE